MKCGNHSNVQPWKVTNVFCRAIYSCMAPECFILTFPLEKVLTECQKVMPLNCFGFPSLHSVIGLKNWHHLLSQTDVNLMPIMTWLHVFFHT